MLTIDEEPGADPGRRTGDPTRGHDAEGHDRDDHDGEPRYVRQQRRAAEALRSRRSRVHAAVSARLPARRSPVGRAVRGVLTLLGVLVMVVALQMSISVVGAVRSPGNASFKAKWADWLRDHNGATVVNALEEVYFARDAPKKGGQPKHGVERVQAPKIVNIKGNHNPGSGPTKPGQSTPVPTTVPHLPAPAPVRLVTASIANEGVWQPTGPLIGGQPGLYVTQVRPDSVHTSVLVSLAYMDTKLFRLHLMPGTQEPGQKFATPSAVINELRPKVVAAFNSGFRFNDGAGGFYLEGNEAAPLKDGKASIVIYKDGRVDIVQWGRDVRLTADVESVRQNLVLLVDNGRPVQGLNPDDNSVWGPTLNGKVLVPRTGVCVDAQGGVIYVGGPGMNITTLADTMARAGCIRGMELDINYEWAVYNIFDHTNPSDPSQVQGRKLYDEQQQSTDHFLSDNARDFFMLTTR